MPANTEPIFGLTPNNGAVTFVNADGTTAKTVWTAGSNGSLLRSLNVHSTDTANRTVNVTARIGGTDYLLGSVLIPDLSGSNGGTDPAVELLDFAYIPGAKEGLFLASGDSIKVGPQVAVTATFTITIIALGVDY